MITVVSLGVNSGDLTESGKQAILSANKVLVRTALTRSYQSVVDLKVNHECLDCVYESSRNFSTLTKKLCKAVLESEREYGNVAYLVDGSANEDNSVKALYKAKRGKIKIISGVSKVSGIVDKAQFSACSYTAVSAYDAEELYMQSGFSTPFVMYDLDGQDLASDMKLLLSESFGEETEVKFICGDTVKKIKIYELDRQKNYDYTTAVAIDKIDLLQKSRYTLKDLESIIKRLRRPDGCPWDRVQTPESIRMNVVEEAYELLDAIDLNDDDKVLEESGDMLMQVVFHAVLREERGAFNLGDVVKGVCDKLIFRHTHVFGCDNAKNDAEALDVWDKNKMKEKHQETFSQAVNDVPKCFPALMQAQKVAKRVGKGGWEIQSFDEAKERFIKDFEEFCEAYENGDKASTEKEFGEMLMMSVWLARKSGLDAEETLLETVKSIKKRYNIFEEKVLSDGKDVNGLTKEEWDEYFAYAKAEAKKGDKE